MSDEQATPGTDTVALAALRHGLRIAVHEDRAARAAAAVEEARAAAAADFAVLRDRGIKQVGVTVPGSTQDAGLISIYAGQRDIHVDEDLLILCVRPAELEAYAVPAALRDQRVVKLLDEHFPEFVERRVKPSVRAELQTELEEHDGFVVNRTIGERERVATISRQPATGRCQYRAGKNARELLRAAIDAGLITEEGEIVTQPEATERPEPEPQAMPPARAEAKSAVGKPGVTPTSEQQAVTDAFEAGDSLVVEAGAGTGKTSVLAMSAAAVPGRKGLYVAYNRAVADDAKGKFPRSVRCSTAHSLAMAAVGNQYRHRLNGPRIPAREQAIILDIKGPVTAGERILTPQRIARLALETVGRFCKSADEEITHWHVPRKPGLDTPEVHRALAAVIIPLARRAWAGLTCRRGRLRFEHDHYLKLWQLSKPVLSADFIMFDEAQDASPVILDVVVRQAESQLVAVGDRSQAINGWNGAIDAMDKFPASKRLPLSQSFRFGPTVADEANKWLSILGAGLRLRGFERIPSAVTTLDTPDAVLCRTNAETMAQAMAAMEAGRSAAIVGGGEDVRKLAEAAIDLKAGRPTSHPELFAFTSWAEVQDHAENDATGSDLKVLVDLIDERGPEQIVAMVGRLVDEKQAQVVVSTAHKSKGREWGTVRIATDFREPRRTPDNPDPDVPAELAMLSYVAVTRARLTLDRSGLAWVDRYLPAPQERAA